MRIYRMRATFGKLEDQVLELQPGDNMVLTGGPINGSHGNTNTIKIETV